MNTIDNDTLRGPSAEPMPGSIAEGGHPQVRLSHPAGLARRNRVRTDIETLAVDVSVDIQKASDGDYPNAVRSYLEEYVDEVFGQNGWSLMDYYPIREHGDHHNYLGVKINVTSVEDVALDQCQHRYALVRTNYNGGTAWVAGLHKDKDAAVRAARSYIEDHPEATVSVVRYDASDFVESFGADQEAPATIFARCILSRSK